MNVQNVLFNLDKFRMIKMIQMIWYRIQKLTLNHQFKLILNLEDKVKKL